MSETPETLPSTEIFAALRSVCDVTEWYEPAGVMIEAQSKGPSPSAFLMGFVAGLNMSQEWPNAAFAFWKRMRAERDARLGSEDEPSSYLIAGLLAGAFELEDEDAEEVCNSSGCTVAAHCGNTHTYTVGAEIRVDE